MSEKLWLCAPLVSFGLLGCAPMQVQDTLTVGCNPGGVCQVEVTVVDCVVSLNPNTLVVPLPRNQTKTIQWDIVGNEYGFAPNGVVITNPDGEFSAPDLSATGKKFKWKNKHTKPGEYKYSVNVVKTGLNPKACPSHDPVISNQ